MLVVCSLALLGPRGKCVDAQSKRWGIMIFLVFFGLSNFPAQKRKKRDRGNNQSVKAKIDAWTRKERKRFRESWRGGRAPSFPPCIIPFHPIKHRCRAYRRKNSSSTSLSRNAPMADDSNPTGSRGSGVKKHSCSRGRRRRSSRWSRWRRGSYWRIVTQVANHIRSHGALLLNSPVAFFENGKASLQFFVWVWR